MPSCVTASKNSFLSGANVLSTCLIGFVLDLCQEMNNIQLQQLQTEEATRIRLNQTVNKLDHQVQHLTTVSLHQFNTGSVCSDILRHMLNICCGGRNVFYFAVYGMPYPKQSLMLLKSIGKALRNTQEMRIYSNYILGSHK